MSDNAGLVLYRKFGESVVIDSHIVLTPIYFMSILEVNGTRYELTAIQDWPNLDNAIQVEAGWVWCLDGRGWTEKNATLLLRSVIDIGTTEFDKSGIDLVLNVGDKVDYPHVLSLIPIPNLISQCCVVELKCQDTDQQTELLLEKDVSQEIFFSGLKAKITLDGFRGSFGPVLRVVAPPKHSIVRAELLDRRGR